MYRSIVPLKVIVIWVTYRNYNVFSWLSGYEEYWNKEKRG